MANRRRSRKRVFKRITIKHNNISKQCNICKHSIIIYTMEGGKNE